jgi:hypothetical protein
VFKQGRAALEVINKTMGLAFDEFDLEVKLPSFSYEFSFHLERLALCMVAFCSLDSMHLVCICNQ